VRCSPHAAASAPASGSGGGGGAAISAAAGWLALAAGGGVCGNTRGAAPEAAQAAAAGSRPTAAGRGASNADGARVGDASSGATESADSAQGLAHVGGAGQAHGGLNDCHVRRQPHAALCRGRAQHLLERADQHLHAIPVAARRCARAVQARPALRSGPPGRACRMRRGQAQCTDLPAPLSPVMTPKPGPSATVSSSTSAKILQRAASARTRLRGTARAPARAAAPRFPHRHSPACGGNHAARTTSRLPSAKAVARSALRAVTNVRRSLRVGART